jgi:hypothetical protein
VASEAETSLSPGVEVSTSVDGSAGSLVAADRPVLLEGLAVTLDGRSTVASADSNVIDGSIDVDLTLLLSTGRGVVGAEVLDDVVLNERVAGPAVNSEVAVTVGVVVTGVLDGASSTRVPSLATDVVTTVAVPVHGELAAVAVGVGDGAGSVGPEGEVETIVDTGCRAGSLLEETRRRLSFDLGRVGGSDSASDGRDGGKKVGEGNHFDCDELKDCCLKLMEKAGVWMKWIDASIYIWGDNATPTLVLFTILWWRTAMCPLEIETCS